ncbi:MAG: hypothetical protein IT427_14320 [Pirellulales bacterium]|nr:hypothetical protein [Pirellulales bacterium]
MRTITLTLAIGFAVGCGRGESLSQVEGTVTLDGRPLEECNVVFVPTSMEGRAATGRTRASGKFEVQVAPAEYALLFNLLPSSGADDVGLKAEMGARRGTVRSTLPEKYGVVERTPWRVRVPVDSALVLDLQSQ